MSISFVAKMLFEMENERIGDLSEAESRKPASEQHLNNYVFCK
jgi:hypothetical protein